MIFRFSGNNGNALPIVLAFASVGLIMVTSYLAHQARANTKALRSQATVQATLNARAGIYKTVETLYSENTLDTLETISAVDQLFRTDMFDDTDTGFYYESPDINAAQKIFLYKGDSVNTSDVAVRAQGMYSLITSVSVAFNTIRSVEAKLGCVAPAKPDTVLILNNDLPINGRFRGKAHQTVKNIDSVLSTSSSKKQVERIDRFISELKRRNPVIDDTAAFGIPLIVRTSNDIAAISDTVNSHLLLDGATLNVTWRDRRKITVYGDLQVTGSFRVENIEFNVNGDVRILDNAYLNNVAVFSTQRIFIGDNAVFKGDAISMGSIHIYGKAAVKERSSFIAAGVQPQASQCCSIFISESSEFDGTAVALGYFGGIKTDEGVKISGILWAQKAVCHGGTLSGIIKAEYLLDCFSASPPAASKITENVFSGTIEPLSSIGSYKMPYFIGIPQIISWREF